MRKNSIAEISEKLLNFTTLVDVLNHRKLYQPNQVAYTFLVDGETEEASLTYQELDLRSRAIAARLQSFLAPGERALLVCPPGLDFICAFFGCLYAGIVAVPAYPPRQNQSLSRLQAIVLDAQAAVALTTQPLLANIENQLAENPELAKLQWLATDKINSDNASTWQEPDANSDSLAFLQYTSGSTGTPKGVIVSHGNLLHNSEYIKQAFELTPDSVSVTWLPSFHDMGLIDGIIQPLYTGFLGVLMRPVSFLQKPVQWLAAISRYRATHCGGPNFAYEFCVSKITSEQRETLDLSSWCSAYNGAEPIRRETLERFARTFAPCGFQASFFYPCYGMAENTLMVSGGRVKDKPIYCTVEADALEQNRVVEASSDTKNVRQLVGCGRSWLETKIVIADPELLTQLAPDRVGEIWVSGASVAQGYWKLPEKTKTTFRAYLADTGEGPYLRTGDLGFLKDGELFVTGRLKDLIIIRGRNHYPQDIELTVQKSHPALKPGCVAATSVNITGEERLVVVSEVERSYLRKLISKDVVKNIRQAVAKEHELQVYAIVLVKPGSILRTSSGKIQRNACRQAFLSGSLNVVEVGSDNPHSTRECIHRHTESGALSQKQEATSFSRANELINWLRHYASKRINSRLMDERRSIPPYIVLDFGNHGLLGMQVPEQYGGMALSYRDTLRVFEQLAAIDLTLASFVGVHHILGTHPIRQYASKTVQDELLPRIAQGRELAAFAITEPSAGSNPRAVAATAVPDNNGGWRLNGEKVWIGSGSWAGVINVFVQMLDANHKPMGISGFVVRQDTEGFYQGPEALTMGMRGMVQNSIYLNNVPVSPLQLLGEAGSGMDVAQNTMLQGRLFLGVVSLGGMKRCAQLMLRYSSRRHVSTGRLLDNPVTLVRLSDLTAAITALETLVFTIADLLDRGFAVPEEAYTACKTSGPEFFWQAADNLVQLLGGRGYIETNIAPQILRDARLLRIFEGPTETLNMFVGSRVINKSEELDRFLCEGLGAPAIAQRLKAATEEIKERLTNNKASFSDSHSALRWAYVRTGEVATLAILLAAVQGAFNRLGSEGLHRALNWAKSQFEQKLAHVLSGTPGELVVSDADAVTAQISDYAVTIGDIEQTLAGENHELDQLLQHQTSTNGSTSQSNINLEYTTKKEIIKHSKNGHYQLAEKNHNYREESILSWIEDWLVKVLKVDANSIARDTPFSDYGMDSVIAVEFAQDLEDWLKCGIEATILWNFPTIESLGKHLASVIQTTKDSSPKLPLQVKAEEKTAQLLNESSETQVEAFIALELAEIEKLLGSH